MDEKLCEMRHQRLDEKIEVHDKRINNHSERLDVIERINGRLEERLEGLINQLSALNSIMKWFIGLWLGGIVSFFFYAIQQGVFK